MAHIELELELPDVLDMAAEVGKEIAVRKNWYPKLVKTGKLTADRAAEQQAQMRNVMRLLEDIRRQFPGNPHIMEVSMHTEIKTVVCLAGKSGAGKSTAGWYLQHRYGCELESIARPLKRMAVALFAIPLPDMDDNETKRQPIADGQFKGLVPRQILQSIGDVLRRDYGDDVLAKSLAQRVLRAGGLVPRLAVTDMRRTEEAEWLRQLLPDYRVVTLQLINPAAPPAGGNAEHWTETTAIQADYTILNNGTKEDLYRALDTVMETLDLDRIAKPPRPPALAAEQQAA